jgi:hypothetical protein
LSQQRTGSAPLGDGHRGGPTPGRGTIRHR